MVPRRYPSLTVDVVLLMRAGEQWRVLLIRRKNPPFQGYWAFPGGFVEPDEPLETAARRELQEEAGVEPVHVEQLHTFGDPGRDPRGWTVSVAYLGILSAEESLGVRPRAGSDAADVGWFDVAAPPPLAFDHAEILAHARERVP